MTKYLAAHAFQNGISGKCNRVSYKSVICLQNLQCVQYHMNVAFCTSHTLSLRDQSKSKLYNILSIFNSDHLKQFYSNVNLSWRKFSIKFYNVKINQFHENATIYAWFVFNFTGFLEVRVYSGLNYLCVCLSTIRTFLSPTKINFSLMHSLKIIQTNGLCSPKISIHHSIK